MMIMKNLKRLKILQNLKNLKNMKNMKNMKNIQNIIKVKELFQKNYPKIIRARKFWIFVIGAAMPLMVLLILFNLANTKKDQENAKDKNALSTVGQVATADDTGWYQQNDNEKNEKNLNNINNMINQKNEKNQKVDLSQLRALILGKGMNRHQGSYEDNEAIKAMQAQITSNQITVNDDNNKESENNDNGLQNKVNEKNKKNEEDKDYVGAKIQHPLSPFELQAGSVIPAVLMTGINSDLPGQMTAQVSENVYDSMTGNTILIPQGTKVVGEYDSKTIYGQARVLVVWKRLLFPSGQSLDLAGMPGVDVSGYAGFEDGVDNHYSTLFGSVILMSLLSSGAQLSQPQTSGNILNGSNNVSVNQMLAQSLGTNIANTGNSLLQKDTAIKPTILIRPGYLFDITVTKDMVFDGVNPDE